MIELNGKLLDRIVIASGNSNKFVEFRSLLAPLGIKLLFGKDLASLEVEETGTSFVENARLKARAWAVMTGLPALADDSGIEVRALNWQPGIHSARIASGDEACRQWLRNSMKDKTDRVACYDAALVLAFPDGRDEWHTLRRCWGHVIQTPRGTNGFGYDPLFVPDGFTETFGILSPEIKAKISHRARASEDLIEMLKTHLQHE